MTVVNRVPGLHRPTRPWWVDIRDADPHGDNPALVRVEISLSDGRYKPGEGEARPGNPVADSAYPGAVLTPMDDPYKFTKRAVYTIRRALRDSLDADPHQRDEGEGPGEAAGVGALVPPSVPQADEIDPVRSRCEVALVRIAAMPCTHGGGTFTCPEMPGGVDSWCASCVAYAAVNSPDPSSQPHPLRSEDVPARHEVSTSAVRGFQNSRPPG